MVDTSAEDDRSTLDAYLAKLGGAVRAMRNERGWSGRDLAKRVGISYSYVTHIENGRRPPSSSVLVRIAEALGVLPSELLARAEKDAGTGPAVKIRNATRSDAVLTELEQLVDRMMPGDKERLLDLARRLAK